MNFLFGCNGGQVNAKLFYQSINRGGITITLKEMEVNINEVYPSRISE